MNSNRRKELLILQLISSDSSSDDEDGICEILALLEQEFQSKRRRLIKNRKRIRSRRALNTPSSSLYGNPESGTENYTTAGNTQLRLITVHKNDTLCRTDLDNISEILLMTYLDDWKQIENEKFRKLFRLSKLSFERLLEMFESFQDVHEKLQPTDNRSRLLLIFLLFAGHQITMKTLAQKIHIYRNSCMIYIDFVLEFLVSLKAALVYLPHTLEEKERIAEDFFNIANLKNVIGCIEKMNFCYRPQSGNADTIATFPAEIICDAYGRFLANHIEILDSKLAKHCDGNYCFLASLKYSLREWTITPCQADDQDPTSSLHVDQELFNEKFLTTYKVLPQSINKLQQRFPQLKCIDTNRVMFAKRFLLACIVLYNFAFDCNDSWQADAADDIKCNQSLAIDPMLSSVVKSELERFKCPKGLVKRDRMIYESCILDAVDIIEQEIEVE